MTRDDEPAALQDDTHALLEQRLRERAAALIAEGRGEIADLVRAWADLHALRRKD